jgi:TRAP-type transport system small permease protein
MRRFTEGYYRFLKIALTILMFLLMIPVTLAILASQIPGVPNYIWTEEMARFCFIWIILVGSIIAVREGTHFTVDVMPDAKSNRSLAAQKLFVDFSIFLTAAVFLIWGYDFVQSSIYQESEMAELPMYYIYSAWPLAGASYILFLVEKTVANIKLFRSTD